MRFDTFLTSSLVASSHLSVMSRLHIDFNESKAQFGFVYIAIKLELDFYSPTELCHIFHLYSYA